MFKHIIDKELELKLLDNCDRDELFALIDSNRPHLKQWLPWVDGTKSNEDLKGFIDSTKQQYINNNGFQLSIWYKGKIAGVIGFHSVNWSNKSTSIGYWLGKEFEGKGIMTRACTVFVDYAFKELKLNRVEIRCAENNYKSRAIPERLGFKNEGTLRESEWLYDHFVSHIVYGMLKDEWKF
ncbi:GNAT family protein [Clostridium sp. OS1-26]|uniref:GNAT family N-acetyltransferase n=1 Tax=Clostridium sp. OS1-26 TaxID=3070681 RepID=UPI0027E1C284|nr:GNAT family protein [Clostridium sp. OS1-26]WML37472.1 GNAT family protein [Clostridium sp. OS1-26]